MPIDKRMSHDDIVRELINAYHKNGKIGDTTPKDEEDAVRIANAIAYSVKEDRVYKLLKELEECLAAATTYGMMDVQPIYAIGQIMSKSDKNKKVEKDDNHSGTEHKLER